MTLPTGDRYATYVERYGVLKRAVEDGNANAIRVLELQLGEMAEAERQVTTIAIHDVAAHYPMRSKEHFDRLFADPRR